MISEGFATGLSLAITRPASIAARARARLSNRPRSTSTTSARLREDVSLLPCFATFNPLGWLRGGRKPRIRRDRARYLPVLPAAAAADGRAAPAHGSSSDYPASRNPQPLALHRRSSCRRPLSPS